MLTIGAVTMPAWVTAVIVSSTAIGAVATVVGQFLNVLLIEKRLKAQDAVRAQQDKARHTELLAAINSKETP